MSQDSTAIVLRGVEDGLRAAASKSSDAAGEDEAAGLSSDAGDVANDAGAIPDLLLMELDLIKAVRQIEVDGNVSQNTQWYVLQRLAGRNDGEVVDYNVIGG